MSMNATKFQVPSIQDRFIYDLIYNCLALPTLAVAYELGLYARLAEAPLTIEEVATALSLTDRAAGAIVGVSAATGFLERRSDDGRPSATVNRSATRRLSTWAVSHWTQFVRR
jgi:hypothetical protein